MTRKRWTNRESMLLLTVLLGLVSIVGLSRWIDSHQPSNDRSVDEERLYLTGNTVKRLALGFNGLAADWYWMRSLQYVGRKVMNVPDDVQLDDLGQLNLKLLAPLLDAATTLDPEFIEPYEYAAVVLPGINVQEAMRITQKGIAANPVEWKLYHHLGYIYWQQHDFQAAANTYARGAKLPDAPLWMEAMSARMAAEGGSRDTAREIYTRIYEQASDSKVKEMAELRLLQLDSLEERDVLKGLLATYKARVGNCPASWRELETALRSLHVKMDPGGAPLDPAGMPYVLTNDCIVELDPKSKIPGK
jgi:tetratricopeptide (TPR) repeat protein